MSMASAVVRMVIGSYMHTVMKPECCYVYDVLHFIHVIFSVARGLISRYSLFCAPVQGESKKTNDIFR